MDDNTLIAALGQVADAYEARSNEFYKEHHRVAEAEGTIEQDDARAGYMLGTAQAFKYVADDLRENLFRLELAAL
jgi:hypothetical protein